MLVQFSLKHESLEHDLNGIKLYQTDGTYQFTYQQVSIIC